MKVERWIPYAEVDVFPSAPFGGLGGWFGFDGPNTWQDYLDAWGPAAHPYIEAVRDSVVHGKIRRGGDWHQSDNDGVPVFSDGTAATFSYRAWGDLMAAIWTREDGKPYSYMDFYMDCLGEAECT